MYRKVLSSCGRMMKPSLCRMYSSPIGDFSAGRPSVSLLKPQVPEIDKIDHETQASIQIARWDPEVNDFRIDTYVYRKGPFMVLDILIAIKSHQDPTLTFRNSCCEGVCGSCAMNINGANTLACITPVTDHTIVFPLPQMPILRDLVVDFRWFFKQVASVQNSVPKPNKELYHIDAIKKRYLEVMKELNEGKSQVSS